MALILPGDPEYVQTLGQLPRWWQRFAHENEGWCNFGVDAANGLLKPLDKQGTIEYIFGGEFEEVYNRENFDEDEIFFDYDQSELSEVNEFYIDL